MEVEQIQLKKIVSGVLLVFDSCEIVDLNQDIQGIMLSPKL
jgi:hypothetical protein